MGSPHASHSNTLSLKGFQRHAAALNQHSPWLLTPTANHGEIRRANQRPDGRGFFPDFLVGVKDRKSPDGVLLAEPKFYFERREETPKADVAGPNDREVTWAGAGLPASTSDERPAARQPGQGERLRVRMRCVGSCRQRTSIELAQTGYNNGW